MREYGYKSYRTVFILILILISFFSVSCMRRISADTSKEEILSMTIPENWDPYKVSDELFFDEYSLIVGYDNESALNSLTESLDAEIIMFIPQIRVALLKTAEKADRTLLAIKGIAHGGIRYATPNYGQGKMQITESYAAIDDQSRNISGDPLLSFQWAHEKIGSRKAWEKGYMGQGVVVAVFDTGVDATHPDLKGQFVNGWDAQTQQVILPGESRDTNGHGTHVAGIIAAKKDNGIGVAGLAPMSRIMPMPSFNWNSFEKAQAIVWAVDNGAKILQNSWTFIFGGYDPILKDAYDYALSHGVSVVFAAANAHMAENWSAPRSWPGILVVGASDIHDEVTGFSNGSAALSVTAPGKRILSTVNMYNSNAIEDPDPGKYAYYNGTSMAAPHVSALVALIVEKYPYATAYQIRRLIEMSAAPIEPPEWSGEFEGHNPWTGFGRIDVQKAMDMELPDDTPGNLLVKSLDGSGNPTDNFFYVTLARKDGPNYWACTNLEGGECSFKSIDPGIYDVYIGEKPRDDGKPSSAFAFYNVSVDCDTELSAVFP